MKDQPAFPITERQEHLDGERVCIDYRGISMRQYYKAAALTGICNNASFLANLCKAGGNAAEDVASACGEVADAMLAEDAEHEAKEKA